MKKILIVISGLNIGGTENSLISLLNLIDYDKYAVDLLVFNKDGYYKRFLPSKVKIYEFNNKEKVMLKTLSELINEKQLTLSTFIRGYYTVKDRFLNCLNIKYDIMNDLTKKLNVRETKYDYAIAYDYRFVNYILNNVHASKYISWYHFSYSDKSKTELIRDESNFKKLDALIVVSETRLIEMEDTFPHIKNKFYFIPNSLNEELIKKRSMKFYPDEYNTKFKICSVGRVESQKNFELAVKAAARLKELIEFDWFVLGDGSQIDDLKSLVDKLNIQDNFHFLGMKTNPYPYIRNADLYVQTSIFEGLCIAVAEALILNTPICVTNIKGLKEYVNNETGLVSELNAEDLSSKILQMHNNINNYNSSSNMIMNDTYLRFTNLLENLENVAHD